MTVYCMHGCKDQSVPTTTVSCISSLHAYSYIQQSGRSVKTMNGSFRVKSPKITENLNPTVSDFNETWYTCCLGTHSTKSKILGQSDQWCGRYGPPNFESFGKNVRGCQPLNPHISGTSDPIFIKLVLMDRQFDKDSKYVILVQIGECLGALTFRPLL